MPRKPKLPQKQETNGRDNFQTPNYAIDLLVPFIPKNIIIWECAAGKGKIVDRLEYHRFTVIGSELQTPTEYQNKDFLSDKPIHQFITYSKSEQFCIITNPPYSLKRKFYEHCLLFKVPFALLIPFDMTKWMWQAFSIDGCQGIIPSRRINYITPTGLSEANGHTAYYHSFWITWGFNLPSQFMWVDLLKKDTINI